MKYKLLMAFALLWLLFLSGCNTKNKCYPDEVDSKIVVINYKVNHSIVECMNYCDNLTWCDKVFGNVSWNKEGCFDLCR